MNRRGWTVSLVVLLGAACGPAVQIDDDDNDNDNDNDTDAISDTGAAASTEADDPVASACAAANDATPALIRATASSFALEFAAFDAVDVPLSCDADPPCEGPDGTHVQLSFSRTEGTSLPTIGQYVTEQMQTLSGTLRTCGCCNGEGDGSPDWDFTDPVEFATLDIAGADPQCVSGELSGVGQFDGPFVAVWCDG